MRGAVQLVQCQPLHLSRHLATHPLLRSLSCALDHRRNLAHTDVPSQQHPQTPLDAAVAGVPLDQQGQDGSLDLSVRLSLLSRWLAVLQCRCTIGSSLLRMVIDFLYHTLQGVLWQLLFLTLSSSFVLF